jgi:glycine dehydrogenase subunit 1
MLGRKGLREMSLQNLEAGAKLEAILTKAGLTKRFTGAFYNELVTAPTPASLSEQLLAAGVHGGFPLGRDLPQLEGCLLWGATPIHIDEDFQRLAKALRVTKEVTG